MGRKKKISFHNDSVENLDDYEDTEDGFSDNYIDAGVNAVASFSFVKDEAPQLQPQVDLIDNRKLQSQPYGITPPIDGENFEVKRTFVFRRSTVKQLNRLKAEHQDENVYLSTIVDEAIRHYYEYVFSKNQPTSG